MPPKVTFIKEDVIQAAFSIVQEQGLKRLSARKVAQRLKSSTAPVYSHFNSMKELEKEVIGKARDLLLQYTRASYTDRVFLNMGTGCAVFSREHSELFRAIFLGRDAFKDIVEEFLNALRKEMIKDPRFTAMPGKDRDALLTKMWTFTHGLAALICVGLIEDDSNEHIINTLLEVGSVVIDAAFAEGQK